MTEDNKIEFSSPFEQSVVEFSHNDVKGDIKLEKRKMLPNLIIRSVIIAICIGLFGYASYMIGASIIESNAAGEMYDSIRVENVLSEIKYSPSLLEPNPMLTFKEMLNSNGDYKNYVGGFDSMSDLEIRRNRYRNFKNMAAQYEDTYAWIYVDYTKINYPVMKGPYTNYYLYKNYKGEYSKEGSIFVDSELSDTYIENRNAVFYGHCMKNGLMFRTLKTFMESANRNTLAKTMNIEVYTEEGLYIYSVLSGYRSDYHSFAKTSFSSDEKYLEWLDSVVANNTLSVRPSYDANSKVCTLITCTNNTLNESERYVVHGILKSFVPASQLG